MGVERTQQKLDQMNGNTRAPPKPLQFTHISALVAERREPEWLLYKVLETEVLAVLAGPRSTFKSFVALDWTMRSAIEGYPGLILSAEGGGLDRRIDAWMRQHGGSRALEEIPIVALEQRLNLRMPVDLGRLEEGIEALARVPRLIVIDTLSKFAGGLDENDNGKVADFLDGLTETLRDEYGSTVLLVAHSGHSDPKRPRGAYALMGNPDAEYIVDRPNAAGMIVTVTRDRFKDTASFEPLAYEAKVIDLGRPDSYGDRVTSLALVGAQIPAPNAKGRGRNQEKVIVALKEWRRARPNSTHITSIDLREICKAQKIDRKREREVLDTFVNSRILTPATGGYTLHGENL